MFNIILIANRGEIAVRIARTARRMGIETVAVYSDADAEAQHVKAASRAFRIGEGPARDSYLNIDRIIEAARLSGAEAIHPGYGFLSENPAFADACVAAGIVFIGPSASAMRAMGSKSAAKSLMQSSGVPLLAGYHGDNQDPDFLADQAVTIGFPVVIKAVSGGGGRGMRVVDNAAGFAPALESARQEAASAFGDDRVLIEKYLQRPRHIEVQIFADNHGNAVHLFERDCSAQRRHQKVIEEAPAPGLTDAQRTAMGNAAIAAAKAVAYTGAGTIEFVVDGSGFYFLEMNTRLQVEHPVTEMVTGFDLVEWQLRVAAGETLPAAQSDIKLNGHAFEVRIYAEDPARDFAPSIGRITSFRMPATGDDVRVDTGFAAGDAVSIHYDAMLAKLICHGRDRTEALMKLRGALTQSEVGGLVTNLDLLHRIAAHPDFEAGGIDTGFIGREAATLLAEQPEPPAFVLAVLALAELAIKPNGEPRGTDPWDATDGWWTNMTPIRTLNFHDELRAYKVLVSREGATWRLQIGDQVMTGLATPMADGETSFIIDGVRTRLMCSAHGETRVLRWAGETWRLRLPDPAAGADDDADAGGSLIATIPGQVTQVLVAAGEPVLRGQVLVVMEAMKTVFRLAAKADSVIAAVHCAAGEMVQEGQVLVSFVET